MGGGGVWNFHERRIYPINIYISAMNSPKYSISIPKPCHEDWNQMTPEQKGRFCGVCNKTVVDFTNKTTTEVDQIIDEKKSEKICGRFNSTQIAGPVTVTVPAYIRAQRYSVTRAFMIALFFVFGAGLFSCTSNSGELVGKIEVTGDMEITEEIVKGEVFTGDTLICIMPLPIKEKAIAVEIPQVGQTIIREELYMLGGPRFTETEVIEPLMVKGEVAPEIIEPEDKIEMMGKPKFMVMESDTPPKITCKLPVVSKIVGDIKIDSAQVEDSNSNIRIVESDPENSSLFAFPNPSSGLITLKYTVKKQEHIAIDVCSIKGGTVMKLVDMPSHHTGEYNTSFDLSELANGIYLIRYNSSKGNETVRVVISK